MLLSFLNTFVSAQALVALAAMMGILVRRLGDRVGCARAAELRLHYSIVAGVALLLLFPVSREDSFSFHPVAHVEIGRASSAPGAAPASAPIVVPFSSGARSEAPLNMIAWIAAVLVLAGTAALARDYFRLSRLLRRAVVFRSVGRVRVAVAEGISSPFSARGLRYAWVVLPPEFLPDPACRNLAIAHELQHHRARDTIWCHALAPLRALCFFHPLRALWCAVIAEAQELACDEVLLQQKKVSAGKYSRSLLYAAETAVKGGRERANAASLSFLSERRLLLRRIENMYARKQTSRWAAPILGLLAGLGLAAGAWASGDWVVDTRISGKRMVEMAEAARKGSEFPIVVNEQVLRQLNHYLGTQKGRDFVAKARANLERLRPELEKELRERKLPEELLAVGLVESGFQNLPQSANPTQKGAGVWQFIPSTARIFGLRVNDQVDDRLDISRETDAAFRYLAANHERFGDWLLGVMAYNMGEKGLDNAIRKAGTRNPWKLAELGLENDTAYLAKFMAAVLILKTSPAAAI